MNVQRAAFTRYGQGRVRTGPGQGYAVARIASFGEALTITSGPSCGGNSAWWQVRFGDGLSGWMMEGYLEPEGPDYYMEPWQGSPSSQNGGSGTSGTQHLSGRGRVCNQSSVNIWLLVEKIPLGQLSGNWQLETLVPRSCTSLATQDVEAIWGRQCNSTDCWHQAWKIGDGFFSVSDGTVSPIPPGLVLQISGAGIKSAWFIDENWPKPNLYSIEYELIR